jgi:vitellogenic carboxypeptidase-like protein
MNQTLFYWYFFNKTAPTDMPIIIWLQGGPGSSGMYGLFKEEGPLQLISTETTPQLVPRENSWLQYAHLLFVDQPKGTGFSWTNNTYDWNEEQVASDFMTFMHEFKFLYPDTNFTSRPWFVIGESYGGKYAPIITTYLIEKEFGMNFGGMALIDPLVFPLVQKSTSRTQIYGGLGLMSPQQISQYTTLQQNCA